MEISVHIYIIRCKETRKIYAATIMTDEEYEFYKHKNDTTECFSLEIITKKIKIK